METGGGGVSDARQKRMSSWSTPVREMSPGRLRGRRRDARFGDGISPRARRVSDVPPLSRADSRRLPRRRGLPSVSPSAARTCNEGAELRGDERTSPEFVDDVFAIKIFARDQPFLFDARREPRASRFASRFILVVSSTTHPRALGIATAAFVSPIVFVSPSLSHPRANTIFDCARQRSASSSVAERQPHDVQHAFRAGSGRCTSSSMPCLPRAGTDSGKMWRSSRRMHRTGSSRAQLVYPFRLMMFPAAPMTRECIVRSTSSAASVPMAGCTSRRRTPPTKS